MKTTPFATTTTVDFLDYFKSSDDDELVTHIDNIFAHPCNLSHSFQLQLQSDEDSMTPDECADKVTFDGSSIDWDGLKRVYDEIEQRGGRLELVLIESVKKMRREISSVTPDILHVAIAMVSHLSDTRYIL